ncbi:MAG: ATP-dependent Clp protease proteolytic subunit [Phycisphaerae bacterium]
MCRRVFALAVLAVLAGAVHAAETVDVLTTTEGKVFEGKVVSKTADTVTFEVRYPSGSKMTMSFEARQVASITRKAAPLPTSAPKAVSQASVADDEPAAPPIEKIAGPSYYVIPLHGSVGRTITAAIIEKSLEDSAKRKPSVVILDVESPGGLITESAKIVEVIRKHAPTQRIVVLAGQDLSAAAVLSMSAKEIYMKPPGLIGAATAYMSGPMPAVISEKMQSVWRATARSSAQCGGHESLLAEGMIDPQLELHLEEKDGKKTVREGPGDKMVLRKGRLLTMTADEAVAYGLAAGKAADYAELGKALGMENWKECKGLGVLLAEHRKKKLDALEADLKKIETDFRNNMKLANENDPINFKYEYYSDTRRYTPKSAETLRTQCGLCRFHLSNAQKNLKDEIAVLSKFEEFKPFTDAIQETVDRLEEAKRQLLRTAAKTGPNDGAR